jgi:hypothetical protein
MRATSPKFFQLRLRGPRTRVSRKTIGPPVGPFVGTALFSFEGTAIARCAVRESSYLENCIEKNFHVPNMRAGPCAEHGLQFQSIVFLKNAS